MENIIYLIEDITYFVSNHMILFVGIILLFLLTMMISYFKIFEKADIDGYKVLIPFYNLYLLLKIADLNGWIFILLLIPGINIIFFFIISMRIGKRFSKNIFFQIMMCILPFIFYPVLAFSKSLYKASEENIEITEQDKETTIYNQFPSMSEVTNGIPEIDSSILALDTDTSVPSVSLDPIAQMEMEESNTDTVSLNNIYSLEETKNTSNIEEANHDGFILDIDPENNTWQDKVKLTEEELTKKVVTIDSATENVTFTSKEKPVEVANLDKFKICPNCHTKLDSRAKVCFLCGSPIEDRK